MHHTGQISQNNNFTLLTILILWVMSPCITECGYQNFKWTCGLHQQV